MKALIIDEVHEKPYISYSVSKAFQYSLQEIGMDADLMGLKGAEKQKQRDLAFYFLYNMPKVCKLRKGNMNILVHIEQLPRQNKSNAYLDQKWRSLKIKTPYFHYIFDGSSTNIEFLQNWKDGYEHRIQAVYCPWGYSPIYDRPMNVSKDIDVGFIGTDTPYRRQIFQMLHTQGLNIQRYRDLYGNAIIDAIHRSKINLNIHNNEISIAETGRIVCLGLSNKAFIISESYEDNLPLKSGQHLVCCCAKDMGDIIKHYLKNTQERELIAQQGYDFVKNNYTMTQSLRQALKEINLI